MHGIAIKVIGETSLQTRSLEALHSTLRTDRLVMLQSICEHLTK